MATYSPADAPTPTITCSVGIMAYNEAANIEKAIDSVLKQSLANAVITEVIVVASGCTDDTVSIVSEIATAETRVRLIVQEHREGKASAINLFLANAHAKLLVMASADVIIKPGSLDALLRPLEDPSVGMVGAHPIPVNDQSTFLGYAVHLLWRLHDRIARETPKLGEVIAFRNVVPSIPSDTPVDEISIQALVTQMKYQLVYEPEAIVYNRGPATVSDFLRQRRRIYCGHLLIRRQQRYEAATMSVKRVAQALLADQSFATLRTSVWTVGAIGLEAWARMLGTYDHWRRRPQYLWQMAMTTKSQISPDLQASVFQSVLVFHIMGYHDFELELGSRGAQMLMSELTLQIRRTLGADAAVKAERNGTIIALVPMEKSAAEHTAGNLVESIKTTPIRVQGRQNAVAVQLACGIIAFMQTGNALVTSVPGDVLAPSPHAREV